MGKLKPFWSTVLLLLLFSIALMNTASAANSSEMKLSDFTSGSNPIDGIGDAKPLMLEVVAIVVGFFLLTCIIAAFLLKEEADAAGKLVIDFLSPSVSKKLYI